MRIMLTPFYRKSAFFPFATDFNISKLGLWKLPWRLPDLTKLPISWGFVSKFLFQKCTYFLLANLKVSIGSCLKTKPEPPVLPDRTGDLSHAASPVHLQASIFHAHDVCLHTRAMLTAQIAARQATQSLIVSASAVAEVQQPLDLSQDTIRRFSTLPSLFMNEYKSVMPLSSLL